MTLVGDACERVRMAGKQENRMVESGSVRGGKKEFDDVGQPRRAGQ